MFDGLLVILKHFSGFCARWLKGIVIDVGCGISEAPPLYVRNISHIDYVGLDPIQTSLERDYPFLCGRIEDVAMCFDHPLFDGAIFSTSLDHIRDLEECGNAMKRTCKAGAVIVFWIGIHDPIVVGERKVLNISGRILEPLSFPLSWAKMLAYSIFCFPLVLLLLKRRQRRLRGGRLLDSLHFHYFTLESARKTLSNYFGCVLEELSVPGTGSVFFAVKI